MNWLDRNIWLGLILVVMVLCLLAALPQGVLGRSFRRRSQGARQPVLPEADGSYLSRQLFDVMDAPFSKQRLLNSHEYWVFRAIEKDVIAARQGYRVFAQTSLGEILKSPNEAAYRAINSKRVDMLVIDSNGWPVLAVEYQGSGHYQGKAAARDAIKKEALRKAGIRYVEVAADEDLKHVSRRVREELGWLGSADDEAAPARFPRAGTAG